MAFYTNKGYLSLAGKENRKGKKSSTASLETNVEKAILLFAIS